jgi:flagellar basal-body rod protein FlgB
MSLVETPLLSLIKGRLHHLGARQKLIAENVANADTAGFTPRDLKPFTPGNLGRTATGGAVGAVRTHVRHIGTDPVRPSPFKAVRTPGSETTLDGNSVVLEEEMIKMQESRADYDAAISFYQKSMGLLRAAARAPGR